jgi:CheY-like chemotaxis protein
VAYKFLITDDSLVARMLLKNILKETGAIFVEAGDGETTLELLAANTEFDLIFMDITMPGIGGMETLRRIRRLYPTLPVVMVTADIQKQTIADAMAAGAFDVIHKKVDHDSIMNLLTRLFGKTSS